MFKWPCWNGFGLPSEPIEPEPIRLPKKKLPFDGNNESPMTTREMFIILDYLKYIQRIYFHDNNAGYVEGMCEYLSRRLSNNLAQNRFQPGEIYFEEEGKDE